MIFFGMVSGNSKHTYAIGNCINWLKNAIKCSFRKVTVWSNFTEFSNSGHMTNAVLTIRLLHWAWLSLRYCFTVPPRFSKSLNFLQIFFVQHSLIYRFFSICSIHPSIFHTLYNMTTKYPPYLNKIIINEKIGHSCARCLPAFQRIQPGLAQILNFSYNR